MILCGDDYRWEVTPGMDDGPGPAIRAFAEKHNLTIYTPSGWFWYIFVTPEVVQSGKVKPEL